MNISKAALIYFTVSMKATWVLMVIFYSPLFLALCLMVNMMGLVYFFKQQITPLIAIALIGFILDCLWHFLGVITFANAPVLPLWLLPLWLSYSVYIGYFFQRFYQYVAIIPIIFPLLTLSSYCIGVSLGESEVHSINYYFSTLIAWALMSYLFIERFFKTRII